MSNKDINSGAMQEATIAEPFVFSLENILKKKQQEYAEREWKKIEEKIAQEEAEKRAKEEAERIKREEEERRKAEKLAKKEAEKRAKEEAERIKREEEERRKAEELAKKEAEKRAKEEAKRIKREEDERRKTIEKNTIYAVIIDEITNSLQAMMTARKMFGWGSSDFRQKTSLLPLEVLSIKGKSNADASSKEINNGGFKCHIEAKQ